MFIKLPLHCTPTWISFLTDPKMSEQPTSPSAIDSEPGTPGSRVRDIDIRLIQILYVFII